MYEADTVSNWAITEPQFEVCPQLEQDSQDLGKPQWQKWLKGGVEKMGETSSYMFNWEPTS